MERYRVTHTRTLLGIPENTEIDDRFRLGRPTGAKVRPILLKLTKSKDKKLIFSNCKKLKGTKVFINGDGFVVSVVAVAAVAVASTTVFC
jgi:hypothetical protein